MEALGPTPMIRQYLQIKERYRDAILFFRLGDFYEMFFEDAEKASRILDIALTSRNKSEGATVPLCGVPYYAAGPYIRKLLEAGHKVAVCEQVEDPRIAKGVVQREVVRVISPGTITETEALDARGNNFLVSVFRGANDFGLALADVSTGEFRLTRVIDWKTLLDEIGRIGPSEILISDEDDGLRSDLGGEFPGVHLSRISPSAFSGPELEGCKSRFWKGEESTEWEAGLRAASAIVSFLQENSPDILRAFREIETYSASQHLLLDDTTRRNLELLSDFRGNKKGSLLGLLDHTRTPMGARRLRQWLLYPLLDVAAIRERQDGVEDLRENYERRQGLRETLKRVQDLERLAGKIVTGQALPRDLVAVRETLCTVGEVKGHLRGLTKDVFSALGQRLWELPEVVSLLERAMVDDPPATAMEGGFIRSGFDPTLDEIRDMRRNAKDWISRFEEAERKRTGIPSLKVRYNRVFGYYIEITKANLRSVPADYVRKQTLVNGERYITPELKEYETKVLNSEEEIGKLETALLTKVREEVALYSSRMKETSDALSTLDVLAALADVADSYHFNRPQVDRELRIKIREGRHPVVEAMSGRGSFVPNDCDLDPAAGQILLLTGPNMAGKSTYMRQVALIVILAQMGAFVPAAEAHIGLVDQIFTRIGAVDALARGESTFMVEMKETAHILRHASRRSLILLDEVGRGTSTFDGISIAWSVAECLHDWPEAPRTLFATHYHELANLARTKERIKNFHFAVKEWGGEVIFLRTLKEGASSHSFGIHVARLAGLPPAVIQRAKQILGGLEGEDAGGRERGKLGSESQPEESGQMALFSPKDQRIREELKTLDVSSMTPIEALNLLYRLSEEAKK